MSDQDSLQPRPRSRTSQSLSAAWEDRTALVRREAEAQRAASEAKTAKLRALRLAKEAIDRQNAPTTKAKAQRKNIRRLG